MSVINQSAREVYAKIVYYGPGLSGKTTTLKRIYESIRATNRGEMVSLATEGDRTLFFDFLPVRVERVGDATVRLALYTVPGQVFYNATRKLVLQGADGVVFVADGRKTATAENNSYWKNLMENLRQNGLSRQEFPIVIQFNKLDLPDARTPAEVDEVKRRGREPVFGAVAIRGEGVVETLHGLLQLAYRQLNARLGLDEKFQLPEREFLSQVFKNVDLRQTALESVFPRANHA